MLAWVGVSGTDPAMDAYYTGVGSSTRASG